LSYTERVQIARDIFIDNVALLAVESSLLRGLESIFSSQVVYELSEEDLDTIASEADDVKQEREALEKKVKILKEGYRICQRHYNKRTKGEAKPANPTFSNTVTPDH
jgi:regulator of replication initiation timing